MPMLMIAYTIPIRLPILSPPLKSANAKLPSKRATLSQLKNVRSLASHTFGSTLLTGCSACFAAPPDPPADALVLVRGLSLPAGADDPVAP